MNNLQYDPGLKELLLRRTGNLAGEFPSAEVAGEEIPVVARLENPALAVDGLRVISRLGPVVTGWVQLEKIVEVHENKNVVSLKASRTFSPALAVSVPEIRADQPALLTAFGADFPSGKGVLAGLADWGFDFVHVNLRNADGSTRLKWLWDQRGGPDLTSPQPFGYGREFSQEQINAALAQPDPYQALSYDPSHFDLSGKGTHGTHVADILGGGGWASGSAPGVAPGVDYIFVHLKADDTRPQDTLGDSARLLDAIAYMVGRAAGRPLVISLSLGATGGPHDGSTLVEIGLDALLDEHRGVVAVMSTGNYYESGMHSHGRLLSGGVLDLPWLVSPLNDERAEMEIWYGSQDRFGLELLDPAGNSLGQVPLGADLLVRMGDLTLASIYHREGDPNNHDHQIDLFLWPGAPGGRWTVRLTGEAVQDGLFHAWIERENFLVQSRFDANVSTPQYTIGSICNGRNTIAVAAYDARFGLQPLPFSSAGPSRDGRRKPDISAPGGGILAACSSRQVNGGRLLDGLTVKSGTSMAAPHVAGAAALVLEAAGPPWLSARQVKNILLQTARMNPPRSAEDRLRYGAGRLDVSAAIAAARVLRNPMHPEEREESFFAAVEPQFEKTVHTRIQTLSTLEETGQEVFSLTLRWPDSCPSDTAYLGAPLVLDRDRQPYLHPDQPTSWAETVQQRGDGRAILLRPGRHPGEFDAPDNLHLISGRHYYLIVPEHIFVHVKSDPDRGWQRRVRYREVPVSEQRVYGLPLFVQNGRLQLLPVGEMQQEWGESRKTLYALAISPYLRGRSQAQLNEDWMHAARVLRQAIGDYPEFNESMLPLHAPLTDDALAETRRRYEPPGQFLRFPDGVQQTYTDLSAYLYLETLRWNPATLDGHTTELLRYLPVPKRSFLEGLETLRAAFDENDNLVVLTGFIPPMAIGMATSLRVAAGESGYRANQSRHMYGDAADLDRSGRRNFNLMAGREAVVNCFVPWPDNPAAAALRACFSVCQFERILLNSSSGAAERHYTLHVECSGYHQPNYAGVYQFRVADLRAANGDQTIADRLGDAGANYADVVTVVPQNGTTRPNAFYPSQLNDPANQPHGHPLFNAVHSNTNLGALLDRLDVAERYITLNVGLRNVGHDLDVQAVVQELFDLYANHRSFLGVTFDLEWYNASPSATTALVTLAAWVREHYPGKFLFPIWFGQTRSRMDWALLQALRDSVVPVYDGSINKAWDSATRTEWTRVVLDKNMLRQHWDSRHNLRSYGQNLALPPGIPSTDMSNALKWIGRRARLFGSCIFAFQFSHYGQNWMGRTPYLQAILTEMGER